MDLLFNFISILKRSGTNLLHHLWWNLSKLSVLKALYINQIPPWTEVKGQVFSNQLSINNILGVYDIHLTPFYDLGECKSTMQSLVDELNKDNILY